MPKPKSINELLRTGGKRLNKLNLKSRARAKTLEHVCAALSSPLAQTVVSAGLDDDQLTIGVASASWATRLRYVTDTLRLRVGTSMGVEIRTIRIKVVPPRA